MGKRLILFGDHQQLPPVVKCSKPEVNSLSYTMIQRLMDKYNNSTIINNNNKSAIKFNYFCKVLTLQYRMHGTIMKWSGDNFYNSALVAHHSCADRDLSSFIKSKEGSLLFKVPSAMLWLDTRGCSYESCPNRQGKKSTEKSKSNRYEALVVIKYLEHLSSILKVDCKKDRWVD